MKMISEALIDKVMEDLERSDFENELQVFKTKHPLIHAYVLNDQLDMLSEEEFQILYFNAMVIVKCFEQEGVVERSVDESVVEEIESSNWSLLHDTKPQSFNNKLDVFFENSEQEDLLAFIEDSLVEDEDFSISSASKEIIFVCLKSIVDLLTDSAQ